MEGIQLYVYAANNLLGEPLDILPSRMEPEFLEELKSNGAATAMLSTRDPKLLANPQLIAYRNLVRVKVDNKVVGAFFIERVESAYIGEGEAREEVYKLIGRTLRQGLDWARVEPNGGFKRSSKDDRYFNFATERGSWYVPSQWVAPFVVTQVKKPAPGPNTAWKDQPSDWPSPPWAAKWIWGESYTSPNVKLGACYFRYEFTTAQDATYRVYGAGDDYLGIFIDGEEVLVSNKKNDSYQKTAKVDFFLPAGNHVLGIRGEDIYGQIAGVLAVLYRLENDGRETWITETGQPGWVTRAYPASEPGWTAGEVMLKLIAEAKTRGQAFIQTITPTFTAAADSQGVAWPNQRVWSFKNGQSLSQIIQQLEELSCDIWFDPETLQMHASVARGTDRSQATDTADAIIFRQGKNITRAASVGVGKIVNSLAMKTNEGWVTVRDEPSIAQHGLIESQIDVDGSISFAQSLATVIFAQRAQAEEGASYEILPTAKERPWVDFTLGDWVLAPNREGLLVKRRVMSISVKEADNGRPLYEIEFDTIFQDNERRIIRILEKSGQGGVGGGYSNGGSTSYDGGGPVSPPDLPIAPTPSLPIAPGGLAIVSTGKWTSNGIEPFSEATLTWNAVTANADGSEVVPLAYEVWAHLKAATDTAYELYAQSTAPTAIIRDFTPGTVWQFKVRALDQSGRPGAFSAITEHTMVAPNTRLPAPNAPTLTTANGLLFINWNGQLSNAAPAAQFRYVYAEIATGSATGTYTKVGTALQKDGRQIAVPGLTVGTTYWVRITAVDGAGLESNKSATASIAVQGVDLSGVDTALGKLRTDLTAAETELDQLGVDLDDIDTRVIAIDADVDAVDTKATAAQNAAAAADQKAITARNEAKTADDKAAAAQTSADNAQAKANKAEADALAAAGIAVGKGTIYAQPEPPFPADVNGLWVDIDDKNKPYRGVQGTTYIEPFEGTTNFVQDAVWALSSSGGRGGGGSFTSTTSSAFRAKSYRSDNYRSRGLETEVWVYVATLSGTNLAGLNVCGTPNSASNGYSFVLDTRNGSAGSTSAPFQLRSGTGTQLAPSVKLINGSANVEVNKWYRIAVSVTPTMVRGRVFDEAGTLRAEISLDNTAFTNTSVDLIAYNAWTFDDFKLVQGNTWAEVRDQTIIDAANAAVAAQGTANTAKADAAAADTKATQAGAAAADAQEAADDAHDAANAAAAEALVAKNAAAAADAKAVTATANAKAADDKAVVARNEAKAADDKAVIARRAAEAAASSATEYVKDPQFITGADQVKFSSLDSPSDAGALPLPRGAAAYGKITGNDNWSNGTALPAIPGRTYRLSVDAKLATGTSSGAFRLMVWYLTSDGAPANTYVNSGDSNFVAADGWRTVTWEYTVPTSPPATLVRPALRGGGFAWLVTNFSVTDVTEAKALAKAASDADAKAVAANAAAVTAKNAADAAKAVADDALEAAGDAHDAAEAARLAAVTAQSTADGKNTIFRSTAAPTSTTPGKLNDLWFRRNTTGNGQIIEQYRHDGSVWILEQLTSGVFAFIDAGKVTTGTMDAERIAVGTASIRQLLIGSFDNLFEDPSFERTDTRAITRHARATSVTTNPRTGTRALRIAPTTAAFEAIKHQQAIPVEPGSNWLFGIYLRAETGTLAAGGIELSILHGATEAAAGTAVAIATSEEATTTYDLLTGTFEVPEGSKFIRPRIVCRDVSNAGAYLIDDAVFNKRMAGQLIVDGAILGRHLGVDTVTAQHIIAGAILTPHIGAEQITGGHVQVDTLEGKHIKFDTMEGNHFKAGTVQTRHLSAEVGQELDITSNRSVTIIAGRLDDVATSGDATADSLEQLQTYYSFGPDGAVISTPSSPFQLKLSNDRISMLEQGVEVSYWQNQELHVNSFIGEEVILGNHKLEKYIGSDGANRGTVVRAL